MLSEIARVAISHLNKNGFETFVKYLIEHDSYFSSARTLTEIDKRIIECPPERFYQSADVFLLNYHFFGLYEKFSMNNIDFGELERLILSYLQNRYYSFWQPIEGTTIYSIHNYDSRVIGVTEEKKKEITANL